MTIANIVFFLLHIQLVFPGFYERRLLVDLMSDYNKLERPVYNETDPVILTFGLTLQQIIDVVSLSIIFVTSLKDLNSWRFKGRRLYLWKTSNSCHYSFNF